MEKRPEIIQTARLVMKALDERDREDLLKLVGDEQIARTYMTPDFADRAEADAFFELIRDLSRKETRFVYGIYLEGMLIGFLNDCSLSETEAELGYFVDPACWNRGYASEALRAAVTALFQMGVQMVTAGYFEGNEASRRVMEKRGMHSLDRETVIEYRGAKHRCLHMGIARPLDGR